MVNALRIVRHRFAVALLVALAATGAGRSHAATDIVDTLSRMDGFGTLLGALASTGLDHTLRGPGPFTLFAPADAAFAVVDEDGGGRLAALLAPENRAALAALLARHVVPGTVTLEKIDARPLQVQTVEGSSITLLVIMHNVYVDHYGRVLRAGIPAGNGVIHVIDRVVAPQ